MIRPLRWETGGGLTYIDQSELPGTVVWVHPAGVDEVVDDIRALRVRGAPLIGIAAAYGLVLAAQSARPADSLAAVEDAADALVAARPTAVNLRWAVERVRGCARGARAAGASVPDACLAEAQAIRAEDEAMCRAIGRNGAPLLEGLDAVLTHCNAGSLATAAYGTALSPVYTLLESGRLVHVYADETRPLFQGARLTAWELAAAGVPVTVIADSAAGAVMRRGLVQAVIVGADRIATNGDFANKIGTYQVAVLAHANGIPLYVAAPSSTIDQDLADGDAIPIEERSPEEVLCPAGRRVAPPGVDALNLAFDVTPAEYVSAFITELGVHRPPFAMTLPRSYAGTRLRAGIGEP